MIDNQEDKEQSVICVYVCVLSYLTQYATIVKAKSKKNIEDAIIDFNLNFLCSFARFLHTIDRYCHTLMYIFQKQKETELNDLR